VSDTPTPRTDRLRDIGLKSVSIEAFEALERELAAKNAELQELINGDDPTWAMIAAGYQKESEAKDARIAELEAALRDLFEEYDDRAAQWGSEYLWQKHEDSEVVARSRACLTPTPPKP